MANTKGLEPDTGNTIGNLSSNTPLKIDPVSQGDDHIRATKRATQATFPSIGLGFVGLTAEEMINSYNLVYKGMIAHFVLTLGAPVVLPPGWYLCDGGEIFDTNTFLPNLLDKHIKVVSTGEPTRTTGGANSITLIIAEVAIIASQLPAHSHTATINIDRGGEGGDAIDETDSDTGDNTEIVTNVVGGSANPDLSGAADVHYHPIDPVRENQPVHMVTVTAMYLGLEEDQ